MRGNMLYCTREAFAGVGGFDERLRQAEDLDLLQRLGRAGAEVGHFGESSIATSPRRFRALPLRLGMVATMGRWALGSLNIGHRWPY